MFIINIKSINCESIKKMMMVLLKIGRKLIVPNVMVLYYDL